MWIMKLKRRQRLHTYSYCLTVCLVWCCQPPQWAHCSVPAANSTMTERTKPLSSIKMMYTTLSMLNSFFTNVRIFVLHPNRKNVLLTMATNQMSSKTWNELKQKWHNTLRFTVLRALAEPTACSTPCHPQLSQWDKGQMTVEAFRFGLASLLSP